MNIATDAAARKTFSHKKTIHRNFGMHVGDYTTLTHMLSATSYGVLNRLENAAFMRGTGTLPKTDKELARIAGLAVGRMRKALDEILTWCGDLCRLAGEVLDFPRAMSELAYCESKSALARASVNARYSKNRNVGIKNETQHDSSENPNIEEKSFKINDDDVTDVERTHYSSPYLTSKKDSPCRSPKGDAKPKPDLEEASTTGGTIYDGEFPDLSADAAGPSQVPPETEHPAKRQGAGPSPNSAAPPSRRKRGAQVPDDWRPNETTLAWARNGKIGATDEQITDQVENFRDHHISKGTVFKDFERAFQNWMRNAKRYGHLEMQKRKTGADWVREKKEAEAAIW